MGGRVEDAILGHLAGLLFSGLISVPGPDGPGYTTRANRQICRRGRGGGCDSRRGPQRALLRGGDSTVTSGGRVTSQPR